MSEAVVWARFRITGFHRWADAASHREYLGQRHRHLFGVTVRVPVEHDDRAVEFHDLLDAARDAWPGLEGDDMGARSCEALARVVGTTLIHRLRVPWVDVEVTEDDECGAEVRVT